MNHFFITPGQIFQWLTARHPTAVTALKEHHLTDYLAQLECRPKKWGSGLISLHYINHHCRRHFAPIMQRILLSEGKAGRNREHLPPDDQPGQLPAASSVSIWSW